MGGATNQVRTSEKNDRFSPSLFLLVFKAALLLFVCFVCFFLFCFILVERGSLLISAGMSSESWRFYYRVVLSTRDVQYHIWSLVAHAFHPSI